MTTLDISGIEAIGFSIPYRKPLRFASGEVHSADHVLVRVRTSDGLVGHAEAPARPFTYGETQQSIIAAVETLFRDVVVGRSALDTEAIRAGLHRTVGNHTAKAAVDMACWDVVGQALGQPVHRLLGGWAPHMRVCHMLGFDAPAAMVDEAHRMRDLHGITCFKVKVGRRPAQLDIDVCHALRETFGDDIELYIDGNRGWSASESARALDRMADLGLTLAEELCPADDVLGRRWLVRQCPVPFVADESATTPAEVTRALVDGSATAISIKTARSGFTDSRRILHLAEGLGAEVVLGNQIDGQIGTLCAVVFGAAHRHTSARPGELSNFLDMADDLLATPLRITDGVLTAPTEPGLGLVIDDDKLGRYRTNPTR